MLSDIRLKNFMLEFVIDLDKSCVNVKNVVVYVDFVDFVVVVEHLTFTFSPVFSLDFSLI